MRDNTDTDRIDWLAQVCHVKAPHAPHFAVQPDGSARVWDQYTGLTTMGEGEDIREAIDAAMALTQPIILRD